MQTHILGFPRIGRNRELKKALEGYWKGELSENQLHETADELKKRHWKFQHDAGLSFVTVGDFSLYDHVLDLTVALGAIPHRFQNAGSALDTYFAMARGDGNRNIPAMEMTKWFNTNYHYIVPELSAGQSFKPSIPRALQGRDGVFPLGQPAATYGNLHQFSGTSCPAVRLDTNRRTDPVHGYVGKPAEDIPRDVPQAP